MKGFYETDGFRQREACKTSDKLSEAIAKKEFYSWEQEEKENARKEWIKTLPKAVNSGKILIDKIMYGFTDPWGGWLMELPQEPVEDLEAWFSENFNPEFLE